MAGASIPSRVSRVLIISLGNPHPYLETRHSAGHWALESLQQALASEGFKQPGFQNLRVSKRMVDASLGPRYWLQKSPMQMNVSGGWVVRAWAERGMMPVTKKKAGTMPKEEFPKPVRVEDECWGMVIINDDLELPVGEIKLRDWGSSTRGHNGIKDIMLKMRPDFRLVRDTTGSLPRWMRMSIGIGRPEKRTKKQVSEYVLAPLTGAERHILRKAGPRLLENLKAIEAKWEAEADAIEEAAKTAAAEAVTKAEIAARLEELKLAEKAKDAETAEKKETKMAQGEKAEAEKVEAVKVEAEKVEADMAETENEAEMTETTVEPRTEKAHLPDQDSNGENGLAESKL